MWCVRFLLSQCNSIVPQILHLVFTLLSSNDSWGSLVEIWNLITFPLFLIFFVPGPRVFGNACDDINLTIKDMSGNMEYRLAINKTRTNGLLPMKGGCLHNLISYFIITSYNISSWPHVIYHIHLYHIMNLIFHLVELASILIVFTVMFFLSLSLCWYDFPRTLWFFLTWIDFNFNLTFQTRNKHINSGLVCWLRAYLQRP